MSEVREYRVKYVNVFPHRQKPDAYYKQALIAADRESFTDHTGIPSTATATAGDIGDAVLHSIRDSLPDGIMKPVKTHVFINPVEGRVVPARHTDSVRPDDRVSVLIVYPGVTEPSFGGAKKKGRRSRKSSRSSKRSKRSKRSKTPKRKQKRKSHSRAK